MPELREWKINFMGFKYSAQRYHTLKVGSPKDIYHQSHRPMQAMETKEVEMEGEWLNFWIPYIYLEADLFNLNAAAGNGSPQHEKICSVRREAALIRVFERQCEGLINV